MALDTVNALVSPDDVKAFLKIASESEDPIIETFINKASIWANDFTQRLLLSRTLTEYYDGEGETELLLRQYPVTALTNLYDDPLRAFGAGTAIDIANNVVLDGEKGIVRLWNQAVAFNDGIFNVKVVYTAGYALASVPESIKEAVLLYIGNLYRRQYQDQRFGVSSETIGDRTTNYANDEFPAKAKALLNPYRSERAVLGVF
ncbi:MAG: hypothetical protein E6Q97_34960 [Desulfurellales bacterium]|nr:MAG: hypothetical protein E6Q97_34960 [Desulfurellales bacterium]